MDSFRCLPLSRLSGIEKGNEITGEIKDGYYYLKWGKSHLAFPEKLLVDIKNNFFKTSGWYHLGASMTNPTEGGLGDYLQNKQHVWEQHSPRFASMIAAIMVHKRMIAFRRIKNEFEIKKI